MPSSVAAPQATRGGIRPLGGKSLTQPLQIRPGGRGIGGTGAIPQAQEQGFRGPYPRLALGVEA